MMNLKNLFSHRELVPTWLIALFIVIAFLGFADAAYLAVLHYQNAVPPCSIITGCEVVTTSSYATLLKIPVAVLGSGYYLAILILSFFHLDTKQRGYIAIAFSLTRVGFLAALYFLFLQLFVLHAICIYCIGSIVSSTILFILGIVGLRKIKP